MQEFRDETYRHRASVVRLRQMWRTSTVGLLADVRLAADGRKAVRYGKEVKAAVFGLRAVTCDRPWLRVYLQPKIREVYLPAEWQRDPDGVTYSREKLADVRTFWWETSLCDCDHCMRWRDKSLDWRNH